MGAADEPTLQLAPGAKPAVREGAPLARQPVYRRVIQSRDERLVPLPYSRRDAFRAAATALRVRLYHGPTPASPPVEDYGSGTIRGRRAFLEGTPSMGRFLLGVPFVGQLLGAWVIDVEIRVVEHRGEVVLGMQVQTTLPQPVGDMVVAREFEGILADVQRLKPRVETASAPVHDPIVAPGGTPPDEFTGTLRDYSRCAGLDDLDSLRAGEFPLGRYLWPSEGARGSARLFLGAPGQDSEHLGFRNVCVTAPVGSGKTWSIFRPWAVAAARAGFSTLVFDPKGDLTPTLKATLLASGQRVVVLGTSPEQESVAWNFLDEIEIDEHGRLLSRRAVDALVDALLPVGEEKSSERNIFAHQLHRGWLSGFIQIARYALGEAADPAILYEMTRSEARLRELLDLVRERWPEPVYMRLYLEVNDLFDKFEWGYTAQLRGLANALAPFVHEPLRSRTSAGAAGRRFRIRELDRRPTTLLLACSLRDLEVGRRVASIATALLLAHIYERRPPAPGEPDRRIPMLLLLDETRLLNTKLTEFLSVGRGFKAGVVTCYQELDQVRDEAERREILANSNTLIALRGVSAGSRKMLEERLARATVQVRNPGEADDARRTVSTARQEVAVLGDYEIRTLPGPKHVAVVHIQDGTVAGSRPFLVDLTRNGEALFTT